MVFKLIHPYPHEVKPDKAAFKSVQIVTFVVLILSNEEKHQIYNNNLF